MQFEVSDVDKVMAGVSEAIERVKDALIEGVRYVGEEARNAALEYETQSMPYKDRTRNLRGATGYAIIVNGEVANMGEFGREDSTEEGKQDGRAYAESLAAQFPDGITLVLVAGKNYASYVAARGFDVLDSAALKAEELLPEIQKMIDELIEEEL